MLIDPFVLFSKFFLFSELREVEVAILTVIAKIPDFSIGVYRPNFTCKIHQGESLTWFIAENFVRIAKKHEIFTLVNVKSAHPVYIQRSKIKVVLVYCKWTLNQDDDDDDERVSCRPFQCTQF